MFIQRLHGTVWVKINSGRSFWQTDGCLHFKLIQVPFLDFPHYFHKSPWVEKNTMGCSPWTTDQPTLSIQFPWGWETRDHHYIRSLLMELTYKAHLGQWQDSTDILWTTWQLRRGFIGQGKMDSGTEARPPPDKEKMPYTLAKGRVRTCSRSQHTLSTGKG